MTSNVSLNCLVRNRKLKVKYCYKNSSLFELAYCNTEHVFVLSSQEHVKEEKTQERQEAKKVKKREKGEG